VAVTYANRGGMPGLKRLPGTAESTGPGKVDVDGFEYGQGRADLRIAQGGDGEVYVITKSDGSIRKMTASLGPPVITSIASGTNNIKLNWRSVPGWNYRVQTMTNVFDAAWIDIPGDVLATGTGAAKTIAQTDSAQFFRVKWVP
jgi:hypothetical protein